MGILKRAADWIDEKQSLFAETIATEGSKTIREARKEVMRCIETIRISAEEARRIHGETIPLTKRQETRIEWAITSGSRLD